MSKNIHPEELERWLKEFVNYKKSSDENRECRICYHFATPSHCCKNKELILKIEPDFTCLMWSLT